MNTPTIDHFRQALAQAMQDKNMTQKDVSLACGVSQGAISNFLAGKRSLRLESAIKLWGFICPEQKTEVENETERLRQG